MLALFFAFLLVANAAICDPTLSDDLTTLFADYLEYTDERPPASFSLTFNPDTAEESVEQYLIAIRDYLTSPALANETKARVADEVSTRWATIRQEYNALGSISQGLVQACVKIKAANILSVMEAKQAAAEAALASGYSSYKNYANAISLALSKWESAAGGNSVSTLLSTQVAVETLRVAQRALDCLVFTTDVERQVYTNLSDAINKTAIWFANDGQSCDATCLQNLESSLEAAVIDVLYSEIALRRATWLAEKLQNDWQGILADLKDLANIIKDKSEQAFPLAVERLKDFVANNTWLDAVDQALEGLQCDVASATVTVTYPLDTVSFNVQALDCSTSSLSQADLDQTLCDRLVALVAGTGATSPSQFTCVPTKKRGIQSSSVTIVGADNAGTGIMATLTLLLVTFLFHFF